MKMAKLDFKAEMWAYATTLYEIFTGGRIPALDEVYTLVCI